MPRILSCFFQKDFMLFTEYVLKLTWNLTSWLKTKQFDIQHVCLNCNRDWFDSPWPVLFSHCPSSRTWHKYLTFQKTLIPIDKELFHGNVNYNFEDLSNCYIEIFTNFCTIFEDKKNCSQMNVIVDSSAIFRKRSLLKIVCSLLE